MQSVGRARASPLRAAPEQGRPHKFGCAVAVRGRAGGYGQGESAAETPAGLQRASSRRGRQRGRRQARGPRPGERRGPRRRAGAPGGSAAVRASRQPGRWGGERAALARSRSARPLLPSGRAFVVSLHPPGWKKGGRGGGRQEGRGFCPSPVLLYVVICLYD